MGNFTSTSSNSYQTYTTSDLLLDQMEKQVYTHKVADSWSWTEIVAHFCAIVLSTVTALLMGNFCQGFGEPKSKPVLVDAACQTEEGVFIELTVSRDWDSCHFEDKIEDDNNSDTTETTEMFTDAESENYDQSFNCDDSDWEDADSFDDELFYAICDACESCASCDSESQAEPLLSLSSMVFAGENHSNPVHLEDYLCTCGECPQYDLIAVKVAAAAKISPYYEQYKHSIARLLQAFSTYNEVLGYSTNMIPGAYECLKMWSGDEDKAFSSFVTLYDATL